MALAVPIKPKKKTRALAPAAGLSSCDVQPQGSPSRFRSASSHNPRFTLVVASGGKTVFKQGSKVPIVTGTYDAATPSQNPQVQYQDVGLSIEASVDAEADGDLRLRSKVEQSDVSADKSGFSAQDPILRQTVLDDTGRLTPGKPFNLGSIYVPGSTRQQEIEVVAELVR